MVFDLEVLKKIFFIVPLVLFIHEMEEWNIYHYHKKNYTNGVFEETILGTRLWLFFLSIIGFVWTTICYIIPNTTISSILMMLLIDFTLLNAIQHIVVSLKTKKYNPGLIFGGFIAIIVAIIVIKNILYHSIIPNWGVVLILFLIIPILIESIISSKNNKLPKMLVGILRFSAKLDKFMST